MILRILAGLGAAGAFFAFAIAMAWAFDDARKSTLLDYFKDVLVFVTVFAAFMAGVIAIGSGLMYAFTGSF